MTLYLVALYYYQGEKRKTGEHQHHCCYVIHDFQG